MAPRQAPQYAEVDEIFDALRHTRRRHIVGSLLSQKDQCVTTELELDDLLDEQCDTERQRIALYHKHLPKLAAGGFIEWEPDSLIIRTGPRFDQIAEFITTIQTHTDHLPDKYA
jgi:hypothetical protein